MAPTKEELDRALNEIKATFLSREAKLAKAYAEHPEPDAWYLNFISCLAKVAGGPPTSEGQPAAGVEAQAANNSGGHTSNVTAVAGIKRPRVEDGGNNDTGKKVRVMQSTGVTEYTFSGPVKLWVEGTAGGDMDEASRGTSSFGGDSKSREAKLIVRGRKTVRVESLSAADVEVTTKTVRDRHQLESSALTAIGDLDVKKEEEDMKPRTKTASVAQEEVKQEIQGKLERPAKLRPGRLTRGIRPRKRGILSDSD